LATAPAWLANDSSLLMALTLSPASLAVRASASVALSAVTCSAVAEPAVW
jgi:hypothetical protein